MTEIQREQLVDSINSKNVIAESIQHIPLIGAKPYIIANFFLFLYKYYKYTKKVRKNKGFLNF